MAEWWLIFSMNPRHLFQMEKQLLLFQSWGRDAKSKKLYILYAMYIIYNPMYMYMNMYVYMYMYMYMYMYLYMNSTRKCIRICIPKNPHPENGTRRNMISDKLRWYRIWPCSIVLFSSLEFAG